MTKPESCKGCALESIGKGFVPFEWNPEKFRGLAIIGDAEGAPEVQESKPFRPYGQGGSLLADAMRNVLINRSEVAMSNCVACQPPKDWLKGAPWEWKSIGQCTSTNLRQFIETVRPTAILALGETALTQLAERPKGKYGTSDYIRGYVIPGAGIAKGIPIIASYSPKAIRMGSAHLTPLLERDLRRAFLLATGKLVEGKHYALDLSTLNLNYQTAPTIEEAWEYVRTIDPSLPLAFDIETPMSSRSDEDERTSFTDRDIKLFQATQRRGHGIALPYRDEFVEVIKAILAKCPTKIGFNNWNFDDPVFEANGVKFEVTDDAMVMFGHYWSDLPKNLQAAAGMCGFQFPWKHMNESDLAFYGIADVDATLCVYEHMSKILSGEEIQ